MDVCKACRVTARRMLVVYECTTSKRRNKMTDCWQLMWRCRGILVTQKWVMASIYPFLFQNPGIVYTWSLSWLSWALKLKSYIFFITIVSPSQLPELMCFTDYVLKENMSAPIKGSHKASDLLLRFKRKNFFHYSQFISVITWKTLVIEL